MKIPAHRTLLLSTLLLAGGIAHAADLRAAAVETDRATTTVSYADLNLASQGGVATLYKRLGRAADRVCGEDDARNLRAHAAFRECRAASLERAVQQVGHPGVLALHATRQAVAARG